MVRSASSQNTPTCVRDNQDSTIQFRTEALDLNEGRMNQKHVTIRGTATITNRQKSLTVPEGSASSFGGRALVIIRGSALISALETSEVCREDLPQKFRLAVGHRYEHMRLVGFPASFAPRRRRVESGSLDFTP